MALQQDLRKEEDMNLIEDVRLHWRQPKVLLTRFQTWVSHQPVAVEALVATIGGSGQVLLCVYGVTVHCKQYCIYLDEVDPIVDDVA